MEAEGQLHLLGCRVRLQGTDDLRRGESLQSTSLGRAAPNPIPRAPQGRVRSGKYLPHHSTSVCTGRAGAEPQGCSGSPCGPGERRGQGELQTGKTGRGANTEGQRYTPESQHILDSPLAHPAGISLLNHRKGQRPRTPPAPLPAKSLPSACSCPGR